MPPRRTPTSSGRTALLIALAVLVLAVSAAALLAIRRYSTTPTPQADRPPIELEPADVRRLGALLAVMLLATVAILAFVVGAYLVMRVGRNLLTRNVGGPPTPYVDAWAQYRLSDERIAELTDDDGPPRGGSGPGGQPDDNDDAPRRNP